MGILSLSHSAPVPDGVLVVGKDDTDGDGLSNVGYAWLLSASGTMKDIETFASDTSDVWINGVAAVSDSEFVVVGGERTTIRSNPYLALLVVTADGHLERRSQLVVTSMSNRLLSEVAIDPAGPSGGSLGLFVASGVDVGVDQAISLQRIAVDYPTLVRHRGVESRDRGSRSFVLGQRSQALRRPDPGLRRHAGWNQVSAGERRLLGLGVAAALTLTGDVVWSKFLRATEHSDELFTIVPTQTTWFFAGDCARFTVGETHEVFGYGWVEKLGPATGDELGLLMVGNATYASGFGTAYEQGGRLYCGGWTQNEFDGGGNRAWFAGIDVSGTPAPALAAVQHATGPIGAARPKPPADRLPRGRRARGARRIAASDAAARLADFLHCREPRPVVPCGPYRSPAPLAFTWEGHAGMEPHDDRSPSLRSARGLGRSGGDRAWGPALAESARKSKVTSRPPSPTPSPSEPEVSAEARALGM